jgi:hypothetical protein
MISSVLTATVARPRIRPSITPPVRSGEEVSRGEGDQIY